MKRPTQDKTKVSIDEKAPDPGRLLKDPAALPGIVRALIKYSERQLGAKNNRRRAIDRAWNESARQDAQQRKSTAFEIRDRLVQQDPTLRLPRKDSKLARHIQMQWPNRKRPSLRQIRRWLTEK
jgi:hypothetical protein